MDFRQCKEDDFQRVNDFYRLVVKRLDETINYPKWSDEHPSKEYIADAIKAGTQYICLDDDEIIGAVILNENPDGYYEAGEWSVDLRRGEYLAVHVLAVHPDCAHKGVGTYLVRGCVRTAKQGGYKAIRLDTVPENTPANSLYLKNGFSYAGTKDLLRNYPEIPCFNLYELNL